MKNPTQFQEATPESLEHCREWSEDWPNGLVFNGLLHWGKVANFSELDSFTTAAVINLAESITRRR